MSTAEETRVRFLHMYDRAMHYGDFGPTEELCMPNFACTNPNYEINGIDGIKDSINMQRSAFENFKFEIVLSFATDEGIAIVWEMTGRHVKEIYDVKPSGNNFRAQGISVHELSDGKSIGGWSCGDVVQSLMAAHQDAKAHQTKH